jgi:hypothetical protein
MTLPKISIPEVQIPFEIPTFLSDYVVHFIVAIPVILLLLELYNLVTKRPSISIFSLFTLILLSLLVIVFYLLGSATEESHKLLTVYLVYASLGLILFKLLFMALRKTIGRIIFIFMLAGFAFVTLIQVNSGGLFATKEAPAVDTTVQDELTAKLKELQSKYDALLLVEETKNNASAVVETPKEETTEPTETSTNSENNSSN